MSGADKAALVVQAPDLIPWPDGELPWFGRRVLVDPSEIVRKTKDNPHRPQDGVALMRTIRKLLLESVDHTPRDGSHRQIAEPVLDQPKVFAVLSARLFGAPGKGIILAIEPNESGDAALSRMQVLGVAGTLAIHLRIDLFRLDQSAATVIIETLGTPALLAQAR